MLLREKHFMYVQYSIYTGRDRSLEVESSYAKLNILRDCSLESEPLLFLVNAEIVEEHLPLEGPQVALPRRLTSWDNIYRKESTQNILQYSSTIIVATQFRVVNNTTYQTS